MRRTLAVILLAPALLVGTSGCSLLGGATGTDAGGSASGTPAPSPSVELGLAEMEGVVTEIVPGDDTDAGDNPSAGASYMLDVRDRGYLPLAIDAIPPANLRGVVIGVPIDFDIPDDAGERFDALAALAASTGEPLLVVDFLR